MKLNRTYALISISSVALVVVLAIQVNWLIETARIKEELFNEKANMVLSRTAEALCSDKEVCQNMETCCMKASSNEYKLQLEDDEVNKIDSLLNYYMEYYQFHIDYTFEIIQPEPIKAVQAPMYSALNANVYKCKLNEVTSKSGLELKLIFPEKKQFIRAEMGSMFITSVLLILVVLVLFWRTVLSLMKQKIIAEHTTEFLNNMTHEFKTPLTNIALAGKMMVKENNLAQEEKIKHYSGIILEENEKLRVQVEQVLGMAALERGEIPLVKTKIDLHQLLHDALKCISVQAENKGGEIKLQAEAKLITIEADKTHLANAVCNLIDNAIKYAVTAPIVTIHTHNAANSVVLTVSDNGPGISKEYRDKVFEKYFRVPTGDVHDVKGFGLGLAYVKKIIELHDGTISLQSEKGTGTTFTITLPLAHE